MDWWSRHHWCWKKSLPFIEFVACSVSVVCALSDLCGVCAMVVNPIDVRLCIGDMSVRMTWCPTFIVGVGMTSSVS